MSVVLKEEPGDRFDPDYMEDICSGTFEKGTLFLPIENNEVDFSNEMVNTQRLYNPLVVSCPYRF